jgi:hypothetical protein
MSRQPELEKILQAWYDLEACPASEKDIHREAFNGLLDGSRQGTHLSRQDLVEALRDRYRDFRSAKERELRARLARLR